MGSRPGTWNKSAKCLGGWGVSTCGAKIANKHSESSTPVFAESKFPVEAISWKLDFSTFVVDASSCETHFSMFVVDAISCEISFSTFVVDAISCKLSFFSPGRDFRILFLRTRLALSAQGHSRRHSNIFVSSDSIPAYSDVHRSKNDVCRLEFSCFWIRRSNFVPACPASAKRAET